MKILWFTWKDMKNPYAGGAEVVNEQLAKRLAADGHEVVFLTRRFKGCLDEEVVDGYKIIRVGDYHMVYPEAYKYYKKHLQGWADLVIEEVNTIPFFCNWYVKEKSILFFHQLCREIWFYEMGMYKGLVGYVLESIYLFLLGNREVITVSESTKNDLRRFGFRKRKIHIISEGIEIDPVADLNIEKYEQPTMLSLGALRPMKRTGDILKAFELIKSGNVKLSTLGTFDVINLQLIIAGCTAGGYGASIQKMAQESPYKDSIHVLGKVCKEKKMELMRRSHVLCVTSVKEGWGLVVSEANSQGTPAIAYDADGYRDSVRHGVTGLVCKKNTPDDLAENVLMLLSEESRLEGIRREAHEWGKQLTFDQSYEDFCKTMETVMAKNCAALAHGTATETPNLDLESEYSSDPN